MIIVDTGFWVAFFNRRDTYHNLARQCVPHLQEPMITTLPVVTETCYLLQHRAGTPVMLAFIGALRQGGSQIFQIHDTTLMRIEALMHQYANLPMDFADASLVILAEALGHGRILSTDERDFQTYRWKNHYPFENLLLKNA